MIVYFAASAAHRSEVLLAAVRSFINLFTGLALPLNFTRTQEFSVLVVEMDEKRMTREKCPAYLQNNLVPVESKLKNYPFRVPERRDGTKISRWFRVTAHDFKSLEVPSSPPRRFGTAGFAVSGAGWENASHQRLSLMSKWCFNSFLGHNYKLCFAPTVSKLQIIPRCAATQPLLFFIITGRLKLCFRPWLILQTHCAFLMGLNRNLSTR